MKFDIPEEIKGNWLFGVLCVISLISQSYAETLKCYKGKVSTNTRPSVQQIDCKTAGNVRPIEACFAFKYQTQADGSQDDTRLKFGGVGTSLLGCDSNHRCEHLIQAHKSWMENVTLDGKKGDLYCCNTSNCNDVRVLSMPQSSFPCFIGSTIDNKTQGSMQLCMTQQCLNKTYGNIIDHLCDTDGTCTKYKLTDGGCKQVTEGGVYKYVCCCDHDRCNLPPGRHIAPPSVSHRKYPRGQPMSPMPSDLLPSVQARREAQSQVAGIVSAAVLGTALLVLVVVIGVKQWQRYREKYNFSYMQLTADMMVL